MKKNLLMFLVASFFLTGCTVDLGFVKFGDEDKTEENTEKEQNSHEKPGENGNQEQLPDLGHDEYTATISASGSGFASKFSSGSHFDTQTKQDNLKEYFESQLQYANLLESISCTNLHSQVWDGTTYLQFGSGNGVGALALESNFKIYKVEAKVLCYAKYDDYHNITNIDSWSHFLINGQDNDMTYDGQTNPQVMSFEKTFDSGVNIINLGSKDGRVYLKELVVTWRG